MVPSAVVPNSQSLSKDKSAHTLLHFILLPITFDTSNTSLLGGLLGQVKRRGQGEGSRTTRRTGRREPHDTADREKGVAPHGGQREGSRTTRRTGRREPHHTADREKAASPHGRLGSSVSLTAVGADVGAGLSSTGGLHMERLHTKY